MPHNDDNISAQPTHAAAPRKHDSAHVGAPASGQGRLHDWPLRSVIQRQRLGAWFRWTRKMRLRMSLRALCDAAAADGVSMGVGVIQRIEIMGQDEMAARRREHVSLEVVMWLAAFSGQSLVDVVRMIESGDWRLVGGVTDVAPSAEALADRVRALILTLPPSYQATVAQFAENERLAADLAIQAQLGV